LKRDPGSNAPSLPEHLNRPAAMETAPGSALRSTQRPPKGVKPRGGGGGGGGGGYGGNRPPRREFDRHSQTAKVDSEKKIHQGWTSDPSRLADDLEPGSVAEEARSGAEDTGANEFPVEEEGPAVKTLDEYMAERRQQASSTAAAPATRRANEGIAVDKNQAKKNVEVYVRKEESFFVVEKDESAEQRKKHAGGKKNRQVLEITQRFNEEGGVRGGGGGRGRGRGGGGRGRGGSAGGPGRQYGGGNQAINVDDESAFPELGH